MAAIVGLLNCSTKTVDVLFILLFTKQFAL